MPLQLIPAIPFVLGVSAIALFAVIHRVWAPAPNHVRHLKQRTSWAEERTFVAMNRLRASRHLSAALPGLTEPGQLVEVLTAFEKDGFLTADVTVPAEHRVDLR